MLSVFQPALEHSIAFARQSALATPLVLIRRTPNLDALAEATSWKALDSERRPIERVYQKRVLSILEASAKAAAGAVSKSRPNAAANAAAAVLEARMRPLIRKVNEDTFEQFALRAERIARQVLGQDGKADLGDAEEDAQKWLKEQTAIRIAGVTSATVKRVKKIVTRGFAEGLTIDGIARNIRDSGQFGLSRSFRIARTEVVGASNAGNHFMTSSRLPAARFDKQWSSSVDNRVRDTHVTAHGKTVRMNEVFRLPGGRLRFPGDSTQGASASEIISCRCTAVYVPRRRR